MSENDPIHPTSLKSLIECYVSGEASAAQAQELEQRLVEDENARDEYLKYVNLHTSLRRWFLTGDEEPSLDAEFADLPQRLSRERLENVGPRQRRFWFAALVIVSCAVLSLVLSQATWFRRLDALWAARSCWTESTCSSCPRKTCVRHGGLTYR